MQGSSSGATSYTGVRDVRFVEISPLAGGVDFALDVTGMPLEEAAFLHDLTWAYAWLTANGDPFDREPLNLPTLVYEMSNLVGAIGELPEFLIEFVLKHPLETVGARPNEWVESVKHQIVALAPHAFLALKKRIAEESSRAGRQRKDKDEIISAIEVGDLVLEDSNNADEDERHRSRMLMLCAPPGAPNPEEPLTDLNRHFLRENMRLETLVEAMETKFASSIEAKDAEIKALREVKDDEIAFLKNELRTEHGA